MRLPRSGNLWSQLPGYPSLKRGLCVNLVTPTYHRGVSLDSHGRFFCWWHLCSQSLTWLISQNLSWVQVPTALLYYSNSDVGSFGSHPWCPLPSQTIPNWLHLPLCVWSAKWQPCTRLIPNQRFSLPVGAVLYKETFLHTWGSASFSGIGPKWLSIRFFRDVLSEWNHDDACS